VSQFSLHYIGDNFHVGVPVRAEAAIGLDEIIIHHADDSKVGIQPAGVLGE
jgi:hypothetical protein